MKTYYSEWLRELDWLICTLCIAAHMYAGCPYADNHIIWKRNVNKEIVYLKRAMAEKKQSSDFSIFRLRMKSIKKTISELKTLELPWFLQDEMNFFNENFKEFISSLKNFL